MTGTWNGCPGCCGCGRSRRSPGWTGGGSTTLIIQHAQRFVFAQTPSDDIADILESTEPPRAVVECGGEQYPMDGPVGPVVKRIFDARDDLIRFGPPE